MAQKLILKEHSYGKARVRLSRITRDKSRHSFAEIVAGITLDGDFDRAYSDGDNSSVVATDTIKNLVYVLAAQQGLSSIESFAQLLCTHFLDAYPQVEQATANLEQVPWERISVAGSEHDHAFQGGMSERFTCRVTASRNHVTMRSGFTGLKVLKTTGSGFSGFHRDRYTTLPETNDRIFATTIQAGWPCADLTADWQSARQAVRAALLDVFANQFSKSVQHTLYEMARSAFRVCGLIDEIAITMPNQHHLLANLVPLGVQNPNEVFVPTDEPFGMISATIRRDGLETGA